MDNDKAPIQVAGSRRKFLRRVGMGGTAVAAVVGLTDVAGIPSARATTTTPARGTRPSSGKAVRSVRTRTDKSAADVTCGSMTLKCAGGDCGAACPAGSWCYHFTGCSSGWMCMPGSCTTYHKPCCN